MQQAMDTLCAMVVQLGKKYKIFLPLVTKVIDNHKIVHQRYNSLVTKIIRVSTPKIFSCALGEMLEQSKLFCNIHFMLSGYVQIGASCEK